MVLSPTDYAYMAPELLHEQPYGPGVDVFAFAILTYELLSGVPLLNDCAASEIEQSGLKALAQMVASGWRPGLPKHWPTGKK